MAQVTYLELSAGQEHKFYEVTVDGATLTIRYGRIGTDGQTQHKTLPDAAKAQAEADKKLAEKRKKGYADAVKGQTEKKPVLTFAHAIKPYRQKIEATVRPLIRLERAGASQSVLESKLGGVPYRLEGELWPVGEGGQPMTFLAQLNFGDLPKLQGYPENGILQFFIGKDDFYGCDFLGKDESLKSNYEVRWIPEPITDLSRLEMETGDSSAQAQGARGHVPYSPFEEPRGRGWKMVGQLVKRPMSTRDRLFDKVIGLDFLDESASPDEDLTMGEWLEGKYRELSGEGGHQVGGYPYFTQEDPRLPADPRILLLQIDSDEGIMWGDMGVANFFIHPDDLAQQDFSHVVYNWDCS